MEIAWSQITPKKFELLCCIILEANDFTDIQWLGESGNDKGRDILAWKIESPLSSVKRNTKWVIQCKRFTSKPPTKNDITTFLNSAREHKPDNVLFAVTNTLSSNTKDWFNTIREEYSFQIYLWEERDLIREISKHKRQISERLPEIYNKSEPTLLYEMSPEDYRFSCDEFEEIEFLVFNKLNIEDAREKFIEFIHFIKQNDVDFDWLADNNSAYNN